MTVPLCKLAGPPRGEGTRACRVTSGLSSLPGSRVVCEGFCSFMPHLGSGAHQLMVQNQGDERRGLRLHVGPDAECGLFWAKAGSPRKWPQHS